MADNIVDNNEALTTQFKKSGRTLTSRLKTVGRWAYYLFPVAVGATVAAMTGPGAGLLTTATLSALYITPPSTSLSSPRLLIMIPTCAISLAGAIFCMSTTGQIPSGDDNEAIATRRVLAGENLVVIKVPGKEWFSSYGTPTYNIFEARLLEQNRTGKLLLVTKDKEPETGKIKAYLRVPNRDGTVQYVKTSVSNYNKLKANP